ncbi:methyltransferase domain protein [Streptococcus sp. oral taxon 056 str. F0418]|uniref:class I SAM-dependent methyltransferase n=1 Tax=Streptococcus sp. oral taxon 056 TaxID=712620 RepID=UPI0002181051|nr:class I SAM-dependent methyltransferase [Streptococcus sp. oral taxon 056]EGP67109.1 methyltransferase domain protein [Streptococcus sp. oral taxon 056 str. F0418]
MAEAGHKFLAKLGKKRLRPGGKLATDWLIEQGQFSSDKKVLEVACNMGTTTIELAKKYGCQITAVDLDTKALAQAHLAAAKVGVEEFVTFEKANAMKLPYEDDTFDIVINEAMLTMQTEKGKAKCMEEYYRVLKPGGVLLTHDVMLKQKDEAVRVELSRAINVNVGPLTEGSWIQLARSHRFDRVDTFVGEMTLMSVSGMIYDEGLGGTLKICFNALKKDNYSQFMKMFKMFQKNQEKLGFIAMASWK